MWSQCHSSCRILFAFHEKRAWLFHNSHLGSLIWYDMTATERNSHSSRSSHNLRNTTELFSNVGSHLCSQTCYLNSDNLCFQTSNSWCLVYCAIVFGAGSGSERFAIQLSCFKCWNKQQFQLLQQATTAEAELEARSHLGQLAPICLHVDCPPN